MMTAGTLVRSGMNEVLVKVELNIAQVSFLRAKVIGSDIAANLIMSTTGRRS